MDLAELMDNVSKPYALHVDEHGERLVAMRLADDWEVGFRLHRRGSDRSWSVLEIAVRPHGEDASISGNDMRELPMAALIDEARRLAIKSARPRPATT
ncbi:hypothetical protein [Aeromicrobium wangtongii]|uniref:hypothetical protein n=1 Tax=Aeromicrobium wangtongii TaxID=2969247 RepID=UPI0020173D1B|nr:hypothetical protein [Aeromicrobium wangtongii]MCL3819189.1 hypothetical protein [Aeromicrobium wangtongii]